MQFLRPPVALRPPLTEGWEVLCELGAALGVSLDYAGIFQVQKAIAVQPPDPSPEATPVLIGPAHP